MKRSKSPQYKVLAHIYDTLMEDVDYEAWADFIDEIIQTHRPDAETVLELACGTGSVALSLDELLCYDILATDKSSEMVQIARQKADEQDTNRIRFRVMDFLDIDLERTFDIVFSTFDSVNYLHRPKDIQHLLDEVKKVLAPASLFIFDFTTPKNSIKAIRFLNNEEGYTEDNYRFFRKSKYDPKEQIHYNIFNIEKLNKKDEIVERFHEQHEQKIYTLDQMLDIISETEYTLIAKYDGFTFAEADNKSLRITMVLQCPTIQ